LDCSKIQKLGIELKSWRESLKKCIEIWKKWLNCKKLLLKVPDYHIL